MSQKNRYIILIIIAATFCIRAYDIPNPFSTNGIDEGVHLLQARMVKQNYNYYEELNGDQAPFAILSYALFNGNVIACRLLSFALFTISAFAVFFIGRKFNRDAALLSMFIICLDITLFRESRLASLDIFSAVFFCLALFFTLSYIEKESFYDIICASLLFSLSIATKIIPVFIPLFFILYVAVVKKNRYHTLISVISFVIPLIFLLCFFTTQQMYSGIIARQSHRGFDVFSKLSLLLFIASCFIYLYAIRKWDRKDHRILFLIISSMLIFIPVMLQGRTSQHHFVYLSFPLAILTAIALSSNWKRKIKILTSVFAAINITLILFFVATAPHDIVWDVADDVKMLSKPGDFVISGNPLVAVLSNRFTPSNLTNVAEYHYPQTTINDLIYWLEQNDTKVIVLYYYLSELTGLREYLEETPSWILYNTIKGKGQILFFNITPRFSQDVYEIYIKTDNY